MKNHPKKAWLLSRGLFKSIRVLTVYSNFPTQISTLSNDRNYVYISISLFYSRLVDRRVNKLKVKFSHTHYWVLGPKQIPAYRQSACRQLYAIHPTVGCHYFPPGCSYLPNRTASPPISRYQIIPLDDSHMRVSICPRLLLKSRPVEIHYTRPFGSRANALPLRHTKQIIGRLFRHL